jgi:hypothetical protein
MTGVLIVAKNSRMAGAHDQVWREARRFVVGLFVAYAILVQALAGPFLRAQAAEMARLPDALAIICLSDGAPGHSDPGERKMPHAHGLDCCLPGLRFVALDAPVLVTSQLGVEFAPAPPGHPVVYDPPLSRSPLSALVTVLQPRAPPRFDI